MYTVTVFGNWGDFKNSHDPVIINGVVSCHESMGQGWLFTTESGDRYGIPSTAYVIIEEVKE